MTRRRIRFFALALSLSLYMGILAACSSGNPPGSSNNGPSDTSSIIKIGADLPLSGAEASSGISVENGAALAVSEANAEHLVPGYTLVFDPQDDVGITGQPNPSVGARNVTLLINDAEVAGVIGPFNSALALDELPLTNVASLAQISPTATATCLTQNTPDSGCIEENDLLPTLRPTNRVTFFRTATTDLYEGKVGADYAYKVLRYHSVYVLDDAEIDGTSLANAFLQEFVALGGRVLGQDSLSARQNYASTLQKVARLQPALLYFAGSDSTGGTALRQQMLTTPGLETMPFMSGGGVQTSSFAQAAGSGRGGPVYSTVATVDANRASSATQFLSQYQSSYGPPGAYSGGGYDCAMILLNAIKAAIQAGAKPAANASDMDGARTFRQAVVTALMKTDYDGATGHQSFDANGDTTNTTVTIYQLAEADGTPAWKYVTDETPEPPQQPSQ